MKKNGFTLVEIALPNVLNMFNQAKKDTFLIKAKNILLKQ